MNNMKGITLIALVVTIIILIILAAVSLTVLLGDNGIISRTRNAAIAYDWAAFKEQLILDIHDVVSDLSMKGKTLIKPNDEEFMYGMRNKEYEVTDNGNETITVKKNNKTAIIDETWGIAINGENKPADIIKPTATVSYSTKELTNQPVTVTITLNKEIADPPGWTKVDILNYIKIYTVNVEETIEIKDLAGNVGEVIINVNNIDTEEPNGVATYSPTEPTPGPVTVTITTNKEIETPDGWNKVNDKRYTKIYTENTRETITIKDFASNTGSVDINVNNILVKGDVELPITSGGLIPIKWNETSWVDTTTSDPEWYDYTEQSTGTAGGGTSKWANARTSDGSMLVWIPRYEYKIVSGEHSNVTGKIEVKFIPVSQTTADNGYIIHPAFRNDANNGGWDKELEGFWVGKFESSNDGSDNVKILPNVSSWVNIKLNAAFEKAKAFANNNSLNNYDSHMMKNTEWGAVAYLAHSQYGRNGTQVTINNSSAFLTGRAGSSVTDSSSSTNGTYEYDVTQGMLASTTGNIYGVYDMCGGGWEYIMGVYSNQTGLSGMSTLPEAKYYDNYPTSYSSCNSRKGDAIYETSSSGSNYTTWFSSTSTYVTNDAPWFIRGGGYNNGSTVGMFAFNNYSGAARSNTTFRIICIAP